jgi:hypothetical protein
MRAISLAIFAILIGSQLSGCNAASKEPLVCVPDEAIGFAPIKDNDSEWREQNFKRSDRFLLRPLTANEEASVQAQAAKAEWAFVDTEGVELPIFCSSDATPDNVLCDGVNHLRVNVRTRRFIDIYDAGYIDGSNHASDKVFVAIGACVAAPGSSAP